MRRPDTSISRRSRLCRLGSIKTYQGQRFARILSFETIHIYSLEYKYEAVASVSDGIASGRPRSVCVLVSSKGIGVNRAISSWGYTDWESRFIEVRRPTKSLSQNCTDLCEEDCPLTRAAGYNKRWGRVEAHCGIMAKPFVICHEETDERDRIALLGCLYLFSSRCIRSFDQARALCLHYCFFCAISLCSACPGRLFKQNVYYLQRGICLCHWHW